MKWISVQECQERMESDNIQMIDIRENWEHEVCNIKALHIPMDKVAETFHDKDRSAFYVIVCKSGNRAQAVANMLTSEFNFANVYILEGGIIGWLTNSDIPFENY